MESCDKYFDDNEEDSLGNHFIEVFNYGCFYKYI